MGLILIISSVSVLFVHSLLALLSRMWPSSGHMSSINRMDLNAPSQNKNRLIGALSVFEIKVTKRMFIVASYIL